MKTAIALSVSLLLSRLVFASDYPEITEFYEWIEEHHENLLLLDELMQKDDRFDYIWNIEPPRFRRRDQSRKSVEISDKVTCTNLLPENSNVFISSHENRFEIENGYSLNCGNYLCLVSAVKFRSLFSEEICDESQDISPGICFIQLPNNWYLRYLIVDLNT